MSARARTDSAHISPSAHYTGYVWYRHRLAEPAFATGFGRFAHTVLAPLTWGVRELSGLDLERILLQRHLLLDARLRAAIEEGGVRQVVEIASGLSPRGRRFCQRYPQLRYLEADLPGMAARKRLLLHGEGWLDSRHQVRDVDILAERGELGLAALFAELERGEPVLVITEGLVNYFPLAALEGFWSRLATQLAGFRQGIYLTELYPDLREHPRYRQLRWGIDMVGRLTRGGYWLHYRDEAAIAAAFRRCGFAAVEVFDPDRCALDLPRLAMPSMLRVIEARSV
ncbi:methyltransferase [compost metagenome]